MKLFPRRMDPIDPSRTEESLRTIEQYLRYMAERGDWFSTNVNRRLEELQRKGDEGNGNAEESGT